MARATIVVLAGTDTHADTARLVNALETTREFVETDGDEGRLIFDGAGTAWIPKLIDPDNEYHDLYRSVRDEAAVRGFCAGAFDIADAVEETGLETLDDNDGHPSVRSLVMDGHEIITF